MKEKMDQFNEDEELVLAASKRQLVKIQHHQEKVRIRQEGKEEGLKEGELLKAKENTLMLFKSKYPQEDILMLENLTLSQYNEIFKALIENKNLQIIKEMIKWYKNGYLMRYPLFLFMNTRSSFNNSTR